MLNVAQLLKNITIKKPCLKTVDEPKDVNKLSYKDEATLNSVLYCNERHNKREIPKNENKEPLYKIIKPPKLKLADMDQVVEDNNKLLLKKTWNQIPLSLKKTLINTYLLENNISLSDSKIYALLKMKGIVQYDRTLQRIDSIVIN